MLSAKPWRADAVFFFVTAQAACLFLGTTAIALLQKIGVPGFKTPDEFGCILLGTLSFQGATWILMGVFFRLHHVTWREGLGLDKKKMLLGFLLAIGALILVLPVAAGLQQLSVLLMGKIGWKPETETAVSLLTNATSRASQLYLGFFAVVLAPVAEEFIFRGVLFTFIKQHGYPKTAWIGVSLLFALVHGDASIFIALFVLALVLTWLYEITDSLMAPIFAHALFNAANLVLLKYYPQ